MANTILAYRYPIAAMPLTLSLRSAAAGAAALNANATLVHSGTESGYYSLVVPEAIVGLVWWGVYVSDILVDSGWVSLTDTTDTFFLPQPVATVAGVSAVLVAVQSISGGSVGAYPVRLVARTTGGAVISFCDAVLTLTNVDIYTDIAFADNSDVSGNLLFDLDAGVYYLWFQKVGYTFNNPRKLTVASDGTYVVGDP